MEAEKLQNEIEKLINEALDEDFAKEDITSNIIFDGSRITSAEITSKDTGIICGVEIAKEVFKQVDPNLEVELKIMDGEEVKDGTLIMIIKGETRSIFAGERVALNFMQHLSGIATYTNKFVQKVDGKVKILDTRKTIPGWRYLAKYAVKVGGGTNHRFNLADLIMVKDNHLSAAGGVKPALTKVFANKPNDIKVEVEVENLDQLREVLEFPVDIIMLDNMDIPTMKEAINIVDGRAMIEGSGNVNFETVGKIAETGVDYISTSKITFCAPSLDIHLEVS